MKAARMIAIASSAGLFFLLDQLAKWYARSNQEFTAYLIDPWLGWEYYGNRGVAFSLPVQNTVLLILTPILLVLLAGYYSSRKTTSNGLRIGATLIYAGAMSNYIDRVLFEVTIDYLRVYTSVFNIADIMIVVGILLVILHKEVKESSTP